MTDVTKAADGSPSVQPALLLVGPTGSGKTPLGEYLQAHGLHGRKCVHFDFGAQLRAFAEGSLAPAALSGPDRDHVRELLRTGGLLEDSTFHIARAILAEFLAARRLGPMDVVVLNGLPRHVNQAVGIAGIVDVRLVAQLECSPDVVLQRIESNAGGDRKGRRDDARRLVAEKLKIFDARTRPLLDHYRAQHAKIHTLYVGARMQAADAAALLPPLL